MKTAIRPILVLCACAALAACAPGVPDSGAGVIDPGQGVGFNDYQSYQAAREAELAGRTGMPAGGPDVAAMAEAALNRSGAAGAEAPGATGPVISNDTDRAARNSGVAPVQASPSNPPPQVVTNAAGISDENDFAAVSDQRGIEADATLIAQNRARYRVIEPTALPTREGSDRPNIVAYALQTDNPVGTQLYTRFGFTSAARHERECSRFPSADLAQEEFLAQGGPERDREGLDPDGDGFACDWSPAPFRAVRGG